MYDSTRSLITLSGADAETFLQGLVTQDVLGMHEGQMRFGAMLTPQGKWQHDFFIIKTADGFALDVAQTQRDTLLQKLKLYKLRAAVTIATDETQQLYYLPPNDACGVPDARDGRLPRRLWQPASEPAPQHALPTAAYGDARYALGIPEGGVEITANETAMDASFDVLHGISFTKGCYVGQEVIARMHYKNIARKGWVQLRFDAPPALTCPAPVMLGDATLAELRGVRGAYGIAYARFDAVRDALDAKADVTVDGTRATLALPDWQVDKYTRFLTEQNS